MVFHVELNISVFSFVTDLGEDGAVQVQVRSFVGNDVGDCSHFHANGNVVVSAHSVTPIIVCSGNRFKEKLGPSSLIERRKYSAFDCSKNFISKIKNFLLLFEQKVRGLNTPKVNHFAKL